MPDAASRLHAVQSAVIDAARVARRKPEEVTLVAVSKNRSSEEIEALILAGQRHFGENRVQEAASKWPVLRERYPDVTLHMIGRLQSNKADEAAALFDVIHSLDRPSLGVALTKAGWAKPTYVQVNVGEEEQKGGVALPDLPSFLSTTKSSGLRVAGLMAIPPAEVEPSPYFALLAKLARRHDVSGLSMGMSGDFRAAVMLGATVVRVGTALFED